MSRDILILCLILTPVLALIPFGIGSLYSALQTKKEYAKRGEKITFTQALAINENRHPFY